MEIEDQEGAKIEISKAVFGRGSGFITDDRTVSRRHVAFELENGAKQTSRRVSFEVVGKNPVWVRRNDDDEIRVFRSSETGELSEGDWFCLSGTKPNWFALRRIRVDDWETRVSDEEDEIELGVSSRTGSEFEGFDVSDIDPVKEFGFVVMGHEFDIYPKTMMLDVKKWDWFLEEDRKESSDDEEEDEEFEKRKKRGTSASKKRKKGKEKEDEDWTGESEDDKEIVGTIREGVRPKYSTRSKERGKQPHKDAQGSNKSAQKKIYNSYRDDDDDDDEDEEEDETLGGFVVGDDDIDLEEEEINEDEEEDEFVEDDEEDE